MQLVIKVLKEDIALLGPKVKAKYWVIGFKSKRKIQVQYIQQVPGNCWFTEL